MVRWIDGRSRNELNRMVIYPVEMGNFIEFKNKDDKMLTGHAFRQTDVLELNIKTDIKDGFFGKYNDLLLEIVFKDSSGEPKKLLIDIEDKYANEIIKIINENKNFNFDDYLKFLEIPYERGGEIKYTTLYPKTPNLAKDEELIWTHVDTKGVFNIHASWLDAVTNFRIFQYNFDTHLSNYALVSAIDDIVVTKQKRISESQSSGIYYGTRFGSIRSGFGGGKTRTTSISIGDVVFMVDGRPFITFNQIRDPHGVSRIVKSVKKQATIVEKIMKKTGTKRSGTTIDVDNLKIICITCQRSNPFNSRFCNNCGNSLIIKTAF